MRLIIFGPPGVGKGTISAMLVKNFGITHISSGNIIREIVSSDSEDSKLVKPYLEKGLLVPDEIITRIIEERLKQPDCKNGFVLDGFLVLNIRTGAGVNGFLGLLLKDLLLNLCFCICFTL